MGCKLLAHIVRDEVIALEDIAKGIPHVLEHFAELHWCDGFKVRQSSRSLKTKENVKRMIRKQNVTFKKSGPLKGYKKCLIVATGDLHLLRLASSRLPKSGRVPGPNGTPSISDAQQKFRV